MISTRIKPGYWAAREEFGRRSAPEDFDGLLAKAGTDKPKLLTVNVWLADEGF
jgi:hypothetical protein